MTDIKNILNKKFGMLTIINKVPSPDRKHSWWTCKCDCGNTKIMRIEAIINGITKSCGCLKKSKEIDITNKKVGRLLVINKTDYSIDGRKLWVCQCDCGNIINVYAGTLGNKGIKSCGCLAKERFLPPFKQCKNPTCCIKPLNQFKIRKRKRKNGIIGKSVSAYCLECEKLRKRVSNSILLEIKKNKGSKNKLSCFSYLGYTLEDLKFHLENSFEWWMTWENHGKYNPKTWDDNDPSTWTWNIDHILAHKNFKYASMEDQSFKDCWALSNLRPLSSKENILKSDKSLEEWEQLKASGDIK